jgi:hypothetical protein
MVNGNPVRVVDDFDGAPARPSRSALGNLHAFWLADYEGRGSARIISYDKKHLLVAG